MGRSMQYEDKPNAKVQTPMQKFRQTRRMYSTKPDTNADTFNKTI